MKRSYPKILRNRKRRIQRRLDPGRGWSDQAEPIILKASNIHYDFDLSGIGSAAWSNACYRFNTWSLSFFPQSALRPRKNGGSLDESRLMWQRFPGP